MQQSAFYENDTTLAQYLEFHFGERWHGEANFPKALADAAMDAMDGRPLKRALDIGCACGRTGFELARYFQHVDGIDFSSAFVGKCQELAREKVVRYARPEEGELVSHQERTLASLGLEEAAGRVAFHQGDACNLEPRFTGYDLVLAGNLIDRLYQPSLFLTTIHERINELGLLVIASPYTWLEEYTPRAQWVGGFKKNGEDFFTFDGLAEMLAPHFRLLVEPRSLPFVIRETRNKFQHSFSELTVWEKVSQ
ncbi:putative 4-mercaptohistidine N1-methyltransferase [Marinobacter sp. Arc7-DN-1]|uniref:putative 4-mercaptohistidine N1-methyltransferase n=1 Tax=Marinobacter sp. Arc7-DN-1 TaxID=2304594 RepID=UPI000E44E322|nr:putative 4-mercaptohistidine N1-methyltransferase [Marinobacter sp. Arc7-DN-1]AXS84083.1 putative 4-mercaptohistidine N1-methyltransferase [Marinobacter sp. Arc7-DN-1]